MTIRIPAWWRSNRGDRAVKARICLSAGAALTMILATAMPAWAQGEGAQGDAAADPYFLSSTNPLVNADQRDLEAMALRIVARPEVAKAKAVARERWKTLVAIREPGPEAWPRFEDFLDQFVLHYTLKALNSDPNHPKIVRYNMMAHNWFGTRFPASRQGGGDSPDNVYSLIPVDYGARYELEVMRRQPAPADTTYSLMGNLTPSMTLGSVEGRDVRAGPDGRFVITIGPEDSAGRANHIQSKPDSRYLFIRESLGNWTEKPAVMRIRRLDPPRMPPLSEDELAQRAARYVLDDIPEAYWWLAVMGNRPRNLLSEPFNTGGIGGLVSQSISLGSLKIDDDEAIIVTVEGGGAAFRNIVLHDYWFNALDYAQNTSSLNSGQSAPDADGRFTYVVSAKDPGVQNWLDTQGLRELLIVHRWQGLPRDGSMKAPTISTRHVKFSELEASLPPGVKRASPAQRAAQLKARAADYAQRFAF